jgi:hypothetical protein
LNFRFNIVDSVRGLDLKCDGLARESLDEDLHGDLNKPGETRYVSSAVVARYVLWEKMERLTKRQMARNYICNAQSVAVGVVERSVHRWNILGVGSLFSRR